MKRRLLIILVLLIPVLAQEKAQDRGKFLSPQTTLADDPRRLPIPPGPSGPEGALVLTGGRIFDSTGAPVRLGTVVIERNQIARILPVNSKEWPAGARVIDVGGKTVMPGLIDLHTHIDYIEPSVSTENANSGADAALRGVERLRFYIESGITAIRDVASHGDVPFRLKQWVAQNRIAGPRMFVAGQLITATGGHGSEDLGSGGPLAEAVFEASGPDGWREAVRRQFKRGADLIKIASHFSKAEVAAAVEEAHALGLKITCDCETFYIEWAVNAGVDCIEHPLPRTDDVIREMARRGTQADPTLIPYEFIFDQLGGYFYSTSRRFTFSKEANFDVLRRMKKAGIKMGIGTDLVTDWFRTLPYPYLKEMQNFVEAGFTIPETLAIATRVNAEILDMQSKIGTLESGKLADVIVVNGRPDQNLDDITRIDLVIRDGYVVVENGKVSIPRHTPVAPPRKKQ